MPVETLEELNAQSCCCDLLLCPIPTEICESITVEACGYALPSIPSIVPAEDRCKLYQTRTDKDHLIVSGSDTGTISGRPYSHTVSTDDVRTTVKKKLFVTEEGVRVCLDSRFSTSYDETTIETLTYTDTEGGDAGSVTLVGTTSSTGGGADCDGSLTYSYPDDPDYVEPYAVCEVLSLSPNETWGYAAGVFTLVDPEPPATLPWLSGTLTRTVEFTDPVTYATLQAEMVAVKSLFGSEPWPGSSCVASAGVSIGYADVEEPPPDPLPTPVVACRQIASLTDSRTRYRIPATWPRPMGGGNEAFPGTYFLITYDVIEEPAGWDDEEPTVFRSFYLEDQTLEWTGPGTGEQEDPSWLTSWIEIPAPESGVRRIVNRRLVCREDWQFGVVPQVWGEAVTLPDP